MVRMFISRPKLCHAVGEGEEGHAVGEGGKGHAVQHSTYLKLICLAPLFKKLVNN